MDANDPIPNHGNRFVPVGKVLVYGKAIDGLTRCAHFHSILDILAIKFPCCNKYYPCFACHEECAGHSAARWPRSRFKEYAILCGACGAEHSIESYLSDSTQCLSCNTRFNPKCQEHHHLYFEI